MSCLNYMGFHFLVCRRHFLWPGRRKSKAHQTKVILQYDFIPQKSMEYQNMSALSQKLKSPEKCVQKILAKYLPAWFCSGAPVDSEGEAS